MTKPPSRRVVIRESVAFKTQQEMRDWARIHAPRALATFVEIYTNPHSADGDRIRAASSLLDRAYGKAAQQIIIDDPDEAHVIDLVAQAEFTTSKVMDLPLQMDEIVLPPDPPRDDRPHILGHKDGNRHKKLNGKG
jgi:regulator of extracellular matrix RemA (YlzA/DUF370 family)